MVPDSDPFVPPAPVWKPPFIFAVPKLPMLKLAEPLPLVPSDPELKLPLNEFPPTFAEPPALNPFGSNPKLPENWLPLAVLTVPLALPVICPSTLCRLPPNVFPPMFALPSTLKPFGFTPKLPLTLPLPVFTVPLPLALTEPSGATLTPPEKELPSGAVYEPLALPLTAPPTFCTLPPKVLPPKVALPSTLKPSGLTPKPPLTVPLPVFTVPLPLALTEPSGATLTPPENELPSGPV